MDSFSTIFLAVALIIIMLGMGLSLVPDDFRRVFLYPKAILVGLANQLFLLPLMGFAIAIGLGLNAEIAIGILILAACPGGATSNLISHLAKADVALSVSLTAVSSLVTIITIPFIVNLALLQFLNEGQMIQLGVLETIGKILVIIVIPVAVGMLVRRFRPNFAFKMAKPVRLASAALLALIIVGIIIKERANFISYFQEAGIAAFLLNILTMAIGFGSARLFKIERKQALSIAIESGIQNGTLAIMIATVILENSGYAIAPAVYSLLMFFTGGALIYWGSRQAAAKNPPTVS